MRIHAAADPITRLDDGDMPARVLEFVSGREPGESGSDDDAVFWFSLSEDRRSENRTGSRDTKCFKEVSTSAQIRGWRCGCRRGLRFHTSMSFACSTDWN